VAVRGLAPAVLLALFALASAQPAGPAAILPSIEGWSLRVDLAVPALVGWTGGDAALRRSLTEAGVLSFVQATYRDPEGHFFRVSLYLHATEEDALRALLAAARLLATPVRARVGEVSFLNGRRILVKEALYTIQVTALMSAESLYALATILTEALSAVER
jgi:hypothetical protein